MADDRLFSRDDELRLFALKAATEHGNPLSFEKATPEATRDRIMADARAYHAFLTEKES